MVHIANMDSILIHFTSFCKGDVLSVVQIRFIYLTWNKFLNKVKFWKCMESKGRIITMNPKLHSHFDYWMSQGWISNVTRRLVYLKWFFMSQNMSKLNGFHVIWRVLLKQWNGEFKWPEKKCFLKGRKTWKL
jgi:hypothetical protein